MAEIDKKEKLMLESILSDRKLFFTCYGLLEPRFFEAPLDRVVSEVREYFTKYNDIMKIEHIEAETGVSLNNFEVDDSDRQYVTEEFEEHCKRQAFSQNILKAAEIVAEEGGDFAEILKLMDEAYDVRLDKSLGTSLFENVEQRREEAEEDVDPRYIGIPALDIYGQWERGALHSVVAETAGGKSILLANIADRFSAQGLDVVVISVELSEAKYSGRMDSIVTGLGLKDMDINRLVQELALRKETYGDIITKKVNTSFGVDDLKAYVLEYQLQKGKAPDVLLVDYIDIFGKSLIGRMDIFTYDEIRSHGLRDICHEFKMYGGTAMQLNREGYDLTEISAKHVQGGISKMQAMDWVVGVIATEEDKNNNQWQTKSMKLRNDNVRETKTMYRCPNTLRIIDQPGQKVSTSGKISEMLHNKNNAGKVEKENDEKTENKTRPKVGKLQSAVDLKKRRR